MVALLNPQDQQSATFSNGGLTITGTGTGGSRSISGISSGQYYWEATLTNIAGGNDGIGMSIAGESFTFLAAVSATGGALVFPSGGAIDINGSSSGQTIGACSNGDVICVALSKTNNAIWFRRNGGSWIGTAAGADPAGNLHGFNISALGTPWFACATEGSGGISVQNFGATPFAQAVPSGFTPGFPGAPGLDNHANGSGGASPATFALATSVSNEIIAVIVYIENNGGAAPAVTSITGGSLTFAPRKAVIGPTGGRTELWWASAPTVLTSTTFTVTLAGATDGYVFGAFGVMGCASQTKPWDTNASLTGSQTNGNSLWTPTITGMSTSQANDLFILAVGADANFASGSTAPAGFTSLQKLAGGGSEFADLNTNTQQVSATISGQTYTWASTLTPGHSGQVLFDALAGDAAPILGGPMSSIIL